MDSRVLNQIFTIKKKVFFRSTAKLAHALQARPSHQKGLGIIFYLIEPSPF